MDYEVGPIAFTLHILNLVTDVLSKTFMPYSQDDFKLSKSFDTKLKKNIVRIFMQN